MFQTIEKLRSKPDGTKKKIAFLLAFFVSGIIFVVWLTIIYPDFKNKKLKEANVANSNPSPISAFSDTMSSVFSSLGEKFSDIKSATNMLSKPEIYYNATSSNESTTTINYDSNENATTTN